MKKLEIALHIIKDNGDGQNGRIAGIGFVPLAGIGISSELFCEEFPAALLNEAEADISIEENQLICRSSAWECTFDLNEKIAKMLNDFLNCQSEYQYQLLSVSNFYSGSGFKITAQGKEKMNEELFPAIFSK